MSHRSGFVSLSSQITKRSRAAHFCAHWQSRCYKVHNQNSKLSLLKIQLKTCAKAVIAILFPRVSWLTFCDWIHDGSFLPSICRWTSSTCTNPAYAICGTSASIALLQKYEKSFELIEKYRLQLCLPAFGFHQACKPGLCLLSVVDTPSLCTLHTFHRHCTRTCCSHLCKSISVRNEVPRNLE